ncbi:MAG TPA: hypothetical protein VK585_11435 [Jiangellaceae bacterium]|nr:hypothetical protein [Jiangellaceae bacterium]
MTTGWEDDFDVLPDPTSDESADGWGEPDESDDDRLEQERPPHWD